LATLAAILCIERCLAPHKNFVVVPSQQFSLTHALNVEPMCHERISHVL